LRWLGVAALAAVVLQGVLGGLRVTMLKDQIGIFHACLAQAFFGLLVFIALACSRSWAEASRNRTNSTTARLAITATVLIYLQLALGATMRHQHRDLAILDFPAAYGAVIPDTTAETIATINRWRESRALSEVTPAQIWLQMAHRFTALLIGTTVVAYWVSVRRAGARPMRALHLLSSSWLVLLAFQITLGAWTIWSNKAADVATAHVATGATMLAFGVTISALTLRGRRISEPLPLFEPAAVAEGVRA
jgi:cytochrome c oxidase assembly protein subunit 15